MLKLPGLIDPHVHLREPGATHKEDFDSGTAAALAGGFTQVLAMPNTQPPLTDRETLDLAQQAAQAKARCDYGIFLGAGGDKAAYPQDLAEQVCGLKMYLDQTYGPLRIAGLAGLLAHARAWPRSKPLACHAEGRSLAAALMVAHLLDRSIHICHVSRAEEIMLIRLAKERGLRVTCEATPHHLFLTEEDIPSIGAGRSEVRPRLASAADREALWENLAVINCFATDHAPHTVDEKESADPPPGYPGLETALGLWMTAAANGRLTVDDVVARAYTNPREIYRLPEQADTWIEIDPRQQWQVRAGELHSRCGWSPFEGWKLRGRVRRVTLRGQIVFEDGEVKASLGYGADVVATARTISQ